MINLTVVLAKAVVPDLVTGLVLGVINLKTAYKNEEE